MNAEKAGSEGGSAGCVTFSDPELIVYKAMQFLCSHVSQPPSIL